jgi:hypothetical protein
MDDVSSRPAEDPPDADGADPQLALEKKQHIGGSHLRAPDGRDPSLKRVGSPMLLTKEKTGTPGESIV